MRLETWEATARKLKLEAGTDERRSDRNSSPTESRTRWERIRPEVDRSSLTWKEADRSRSIQTEVDPVLPKVTVVEPAVALLRACVENKAGSPGSWTEE